jgi:hypothetical protein
MRIENKLPGERQGVSPPSVIHCGDVKFHHRGHREHREMSSQGTKSGANIQRVHRHGVPALRLSHPTN